MAVMGWSVVLPVCEQLGRDLPSDTRLHRLLVSHLDIQAQVKPPLQAGDHTPATTGRRHGRAPLWSGTATYRTASIGSGRPEHNMQCCQAPTPCRRNHG